MTFGLFGRKHAPQEETWNLRTMFGPHLNFAATEAYKLLRTNIMFSFPEEGVGRVIGVTSAVQAEGKSSTACNLAYALAETGKGFSQYITVVGLCETVALFALVFSMVALG